MEIAIIVCLTIIIIQLTRIGLYLKSYNVRFLSIKDQNDLIIKHVKNLDLNIELKLEAEERKKSINSMDR